MSIHLSRLLKCFVVAVVLVLCTSSSFLGYAQQPEISVGETVKVVTDGTRLNLRKKPGLTGEIVAKLENGETMRVIEGPRSADGYKWWKLEGEAGTGWAASQFLQVAEPATSKASVSEESPVVTADDTARGSRNMLLKFRDIAPNAKVIGFKGDIMMKDASDWSKRFWSYAIAGEELGRAARKAADEEGIGNLLAVYGNHDVYLHSLQKKWVDIYGFTECGMWGLPSLFDPDWANTLEDVEHGSQKLIEAEYVPRLHLNKSAEDAITTLGTAEVFFFHGHGCEPVGIAFHDDKCIHSCISLEKLEKELPSELPDLKLVVLLACRSGEEDRSKESDEKQRSKPIEEKWEKFWDGLERRIADWWLEGWIGDRIIDWWEEQKEKAKEKAKEELQRQLCGAPAGLVIVSSHQFWRWRRRSKERS